MNVPEIQKALHELRKMGSSKAEISLTILTDDVHCFFRPTGYGEDNPCIGGHGNTPEQCIADARRQWNEMSERVSAETTKKLALAIIRITHEHGHCTDAALRAEFDSADLQKYGSEAVTLANAMAENGPFEIVELKGANAA